MTPHRFTDRVANVEHRSRRIWHRGVGEEAVFSTEPLGWYLILESHLAISVGHDKPEIVSGDTVEITVEKQRGKNSDGA